MVLFTGGGVSAIFFVKRKRGCDETFFVFCHSPVVIVGWIEK